MTILNARESYFLSLIRRHGSLSRRELHEQTGLRPNTVGELAAGMIERGLLREGEPEAGGPGRPRQPLEIDPVRRCVVGLAFEPGQVSACQLSLQGRRTSPVREHRIHDSEELISKAVPLVRELCNDRTLALGISTTGFVDPQTRSILTSSATQRRLPTRLGEVYAAAAGCPVVLENDMHAQATCWLLNQGFNTCEDILLIDLRDGAIGSALLVGGRPNRGCIIGGNELGHARFPVHTEQCYCGQRGCVERICSSEYMRKITKDPSVELEKRISHYDASDQAVGEILRYLSMAITNTLNFIRPNRVVLTGQLTSHRPFCNDLLARVRGLILAPLAERVRIEIWDKPLVLASEAAAWLGLAAIYRSELPTEEAAPEYARVPVSV